MGPSAAFFAVFVAPAIGRRWGDVRGLGAALPAIAALLLLMGALHASQTALIVCVVACGAFLGITNTLMTQVVMESAPVARPIASSACSFLRFCGGAIATFIAGKLAEHVSVGSPCYLGAGMNAIAVVVRWAYRDALRPVDVAAPAPAPSPRSRRRGRGGGRRRRRDGPPGQRDGGAPRARPRPGCARGERHQDRRVGRRGHR